MLLLDAVCYYCGESTSPTNEQTWNDKEKRHGAKILAALRRVTIRSSVVCFQHIIEVICRVQGVGSILPLSAQPDSTMGNSSCTPWQYCRIYDPDLPKSSTIKGMREAAGGRQLAVANSPCLPGRRNEKYTCFFRI